MGLNVPQAGIFTMQLSVDCSQPERLGVGLYTTSHNGKVQMRLYEDHTS